MLQRSDTHIGETATLRSVSLTREDRARHIALFGATGVGKSTLILNILAQDIARGDGVLLLDPHGDLAERALTLVPRERSNEVCYFNLADRTHSVGFNILEDLDPDARPLVVDGVVSAWRAIWPDMWGPRLEQILRHSAAALLEMEHKEVGRLTVGRYESAGAMGTIDLGGVGAATGFGSVSLLQQNFALRTTAGGLSQATWSSFLDPSSYQARQEVLRYDSPAIYGFILSASLAEASGGFVGNTNYGIMLRYAGEHHGFRIAAGAGMEHYGDTYSNTGQLAGTGGITNANILTPGPTAATNSPFTMKTPDINAWGVALSGMHISSGLFLQGAIEGVEYNNAGSATSANWGETCGAATSGGTIVNTAPNSFNGVANTGGCNPKKDAWWWQLQGGIAKNWTGWGNTVLYAEYSKLYDWGAEIGGRNYVSGVNTTANGFTTLQNVTSTTTTVWGLGLVQNFNNAATEWYLGYRNFALDLNSDATCVYGPTPNIATSHAAGTVVGCKISDFNLITTGLRVKF